MPYLSFCNRELVRLFYVLLHFSGVIQQKPAAPWTSTVQVSMEVPPHSRTMLSASPWPLNAALRSFSIKPVFVHRSWIVLRRLSLLNYNDSLNPLRLVLLWVQFSWLYKHYWCLELWISVDRPHIISIISRITRIFIWLLTFHIPLSFLDISRSPFDACRFNIGVNSMYSHKFKTASFLLVQFSAPLDKLNKIFNHYFTWPL